MMVVTNYIGETSHELKTRVQEHQYTCRIHNTNTNINASWHGKMPQSSSKTTTDSHHTKMMFFAVGVGANVSTRNHMTVQQHCPVYFLQYATDKIHQTPGISLTLAISSVSGVYVHACSLYPIYD